MIQTYFGNGKGKTTAAIGGAIRYAGCGQKVLFVSFLKNQNACEFQSMNQISGIDILCSDVCYQLFDNQNESLTPKFCEAYTALFQKVKESSEAYQMIVLDEILDAVCFGYLTETGLLHFLREHQTDCEIILTGHHLPESIKTISDYISEVKAVKHPYDFGISSRKGIEY